MGKVVINEINHPHWNRCVMIKNELIELLVTVDLGPRIISLKANEKENMMFEDLNEEIQQSGEAFKIFGENKKWRIFGGHRLWVSPEIYPYIYYPDDEKVDYVVDGNSVTFIPKKEVYNNIQKEIKITIDEKLPKIIVDHKITNLGEENIKIDPWALSVMAPGGKEVIPCHEFEPSGLLPTKKFILWPYSKLNDARVKVNDDYIIINQSNDENPFKLGMDNHYGWAAYFNKNCLFIKRHNHDKNLEYPDFGCSYETYTNNLMLEMESIGEYKNLNKNEYVKHQETWELYNDIAMPNDEEISSILERFMK